MAIILEASEVQLPWVGQELYMVSPQSGWPTKIPASGLQFNKHFKKLHLSSTDLENFDDFITNIRWPDQLEDTALSEAMHTLELGIIQGKKCLFPNGGTYYYFGVINESWSVYNSNS